MMKKRLVAYVSGTVQKVGYRARMVDLAKALILTGTVENLDDGRVKIVAEGDSEKLKWFEEAIDIKNTMINVSAIEMEYSEPKGEFAKFYKLVEKGETDSRLDAAAVYLKDLIAAVNKLNDNLGQKMDTMIQAQGEMSRNLGGKMDTMIQAQGEMSRNLGGKMDTMIQAQGEMSRNLGGKMDTMIMAQGEMSGKMDTMIMAQGEMSGKMDTMIMAQGEMSGKMDSMIQLQRDSLEVEEELKEEVKDSRKDFKGYLDQRFEKLESEVERLRSALIEKGII